MADHYATLGVPRTATARQITVAFRRAAQRAHPDRGGNTEAMSAINAAYQALSDPARRTHTDRMLAALDPELKAIRELVAGKPPSELHGILAELRTDIRRFEQRGPDGSYGGPLNSPFLAVRRRQVKFLEALLA